MKNLIILTLLTLSLCGCSDNEQQAKRDASQEVDIIGLKGQLEGLQKMVIEQKLEIIKLRSDADKQNAAVWDAMNRNLDASTVLFTLVTNISSVTQKQINLINQPKRTATNR